MPHPKLFEPIQLGGVTLPNRICVSPMCQYSAVEGSMTEWHLVHLGSMAISGAGLVMVEATGVVPEGRITHLCTGLYSDANEASMKRVIDASRKLTKSPIGIQLAHAGRKASTHPPFMGAKPLAAGEAPWQTVGPSAIPYSEGWHVPHELSVSELKSITDAFVSSTERSKRAGFDLIELHSAHGYLLHEFLSPISNKRTDAYGKDRMKFPLEVARAVREAWPKEKALGARINVFDWIDGGFGVEDGVAYAKELKKVGLDFVCVSSGALSPAQKMRVEPGYNVPFTEAVRKGAGIVARAQGMIVDPMHAEQILEKGQADLIGLARALLDNPRWVWHAAERLGAKVDFPPQYMRVQPELWPGAAIARPKKAATA